MESSSLLCTLDLSIRLWHLASWTSTTSRLRSASYRPRRCRHTHKRIITSRAALCCPSNLSCCACTSTRRRERRRRFRPSATSKPSGSPVGVSNPRPRLVWRLVFASNLVMATAIAISQSFRRLFLHPAHALLNIIELRSFFFGVVCFAVLLILGPFDVSSA